MHMSDALISPPVAIAAGAVSVGLIALATRKARNNGRGDSIALMGVMGAFVFVAQMINFSIPGTGSSGHIIGGILLAAMLGRWRGFLAICSVLIVQCLVFADGGLLALGCNILNMGAMSCLVAFPLIYKPITRKAITPGRIMTASVLACVAGLEAGAFLVALETTLSGITLLPFGEFLLFMMPIHLVIGLCEGVATGLVLSYVWRQDPSLLCSCDVADKKRGSIKPLLVAFVAVSAVFAVCAIWIASSDPDGLEWSIMKLTGSTELGPDIVSPTAVMPGYDSSLAGIVGAVIVMAIIWAGAVLIFHRKLPAYNKLNK